MLSNIGNDKAIEFKSEFLKTVKMLKSLKCIEIDVQKYEKKLELIKKECDELIIQIDNENGSDFIETANAELVYIKAIGKLRSLQNDLNKYNIYFRAYNYVASVNLSESFNSDDVNKIVNEVVDLLIKINSSDTRFYEAEKVIVENFYSFVYQLIKLEFKIKGNSKLLTLIKNQPVSINFIEKEVEKEVDNSDNSLINSLVSNIKTQGIDFSYLDENLLLHLSIQDSKILQEVKETLKKL